jgi:hypothetical protein
MRAGLHHFHMFLCREARGHGLWAWPSLSGVKVSFSILLFVAAGLDSDHDGYGMGRFMGNLLLRAFLLPGELVCSALGVTEPEGRMMLRTLVDILVWNAVVILVVVWVSG